MEGVERSDQSAPGTNVYFVVALVSLAGIALEIGLTRLFSALFFPPAVFAILSLAILGIGLGAALVTWQPAWRVVRHVPVYLGCAALAVCAIAVVSSIPAIQRALLILVVIPYLFMGMTLTSFFSSSPEQSSQLYLADLVGAGMGALLAVPLLNWLGGLNGVLAMGLLWALAGAVVFGRQPGWFATAVLAFTLLLFGGSIWSAELTVHMDRLPVDKPIAESLQNGTGAVIDTRWDAFARTDLVDPGDGGPYRLYMDGAAGSVMPPALDNEFLWDDIGLFPFATEQPQRVFLIGPGGGLDVWFALQSGAEEIVAVEVNAASVELVEDFAAYNGGLYDRPEVRTVIDDGRSALQRDDSHYDLIFFSQLVTLAAERNGYALVENSAYTVEAFHEYLDHLTPDGQLGIKLYDEPTLTRAVSTALAAFRERGLSDQEAAQHLIALLDGSVQPAIPLLIVSNSPFTRDDSLSLGAVAQQVGFTPLFLPGVVAEPPLDGVIAGTISFDEVIAASGADLSPTADNRPFFFQFEKGVPATLQPLLWGTIVAILAGSILIALYQRRASGGRQAVVGPLYFAALGLGFILVEIGVIQQTRVFLGHPTTATTVVLATLLISGGLGSGLAGRWLKGRSEFSALPLAAVVLFLALWLLLWPLVQSLALGFSGSWRVLVVMVTLIPLGFVMGMPFPLGLRAVASWGEGQVALAWAVNGLMSVAGAVFAVTLAVQVGFVVVLLAGGAAYGVAAAAGLLLAPLLTR